MGERMPKGATLTAGAGDHGGQGALGHQVRDGCGRHKNAGSPSGEALNCHTFDWPALRSFCSPSQCMMWHSQEV